MTRFSVEQLILADHIGGDLQWSAGASLISDIPQRSHWPLKFHSYLNAGRLDGLNQCKQKKLSV